MVLGVILLVLSVIFGDAIAEYLFKCNPSIAICKPFHALESDLKSQVFLGIIFILSLTLFLVGCSRLKPKTPTKK